MRLYVDVWEDRNDEAHYEFTGTQADQRALEKKIKADRGIIVRSDEVDVPTDKKAELIKWLNTFRLRRESE